MPVMASAGVTPYVVTKKTVFKWQEGFWAKMLAVFNADYKVINHCVMLCCGAALDFPAVWTAIRATRTRMRTHFYKT